jgi:Fe-S-cluster containining protein
MKSVFHGLGRTSGEVMMCFSYPEHVRYRCEKCAQCCGDTENRVRSILLLKSDVTRISEKTALRPGAFAEKIAGFEPYRYRMTKTPDGRCVFLRKTVCSIYAIRPLICRFYPFQLNPGPDGYVFEYTDECPGIGKGRRLTRAFFTALFNRFTDAMERV